MKVPTSIALRAPAILASRVMKVPCSGPICKLADAGNRRGVSSARSLSTGSAGAL